MSSRRIEPEVIDAMFRKAGNKLLSARTSLESEFFDDGSSRAYYSAYHAVCAVLGSRGLSYSSHGQTMGAFNREFVKMGVLESDAFRRLQRLFANRQTGDYDASSTISKDQAARDIAGAEWIIERCREIVNRP